MAIVEVPTRSIPQVEPKEPARPESVEMGKDVTRLEADGQIRIDRHRAEELAKPLAVQNKD